MFNEAYNDIFIYVKTKKQIIRIDEGSGDNWTDDDIAQGYVDYIYYEVYNVQQDLPEVDGGTIMLTEWFQEKFESTKEAIPAVLDMAYGDESIEYIMLNWEENDLRKSVVLWDWFSTLFWCSRPEVYGWFGFWSDIWDKANLWLILLQFIWS